MSALNRTEDDNEDYEERGDRLLQELARMAEAGSSVSVTLTISGAIVTGHTCSASQYFQHFAEVAADQGTLQQGLAEGVGRGDTPPRFLYLREARMLSSSTQFPHRGWGYIRCRIERVDTCMPGHLFEGAHA